ncbi:hypothetical protein RPYSC3_24000 [Rhodopseudomonas palustris]|nr:hypothetical protein RPYSC3_24000 [Rhodopseudomonas palustris]
MELFDQELIHASLECLLVRQLLTLARLDARAQTDDYDPVRLEHWLAIARFRSTLPRGERRREHGTYRPAVSVSIHAPARGATGRHHPLDAHLSVSIHAPARGATGGTGGAATANKGFDPRSRAGSDTPTAEQTRSLTVSIHAPARGATTHRRSACCGRRGFDPRSRVGSDQRIKQSFFRHGVSIHAPARGATWGRGYIVRDYVVSIHAPARGATTADTCPGGRYGFRSTLPRGERRPAEGGLMATVQVSIHAPARGATNYVRRRSATKSFRSTLPRGERPALLR